MDARQNALRELVLRMVVTELPSTYLLYYGFKQFGTVIIGPLPPMGIILRDLVLSFIWTETTFYWSHRMFHHRWFYSSIHKKHHQFKRSMAINTEYSHPLEHLVSITYWSLALAVLVDGDHPLLFGGVALQVGNVLTTVGGPMLLGSHVLVFWLYFTFRLCETLDAHSGYSISIFSALPFFTGPNM